MLVDGLKISEYKLYWLTNFLLINNWVFANNRFSFKVECTSYKKADKQA